MFGTRWKLFRVFGIPISVEVTWLIILVRSDGRMEGYLTT
jgi:hypothetical protein